MIYLGDYLAGATVRFMWNTNDQTGASITRSTDGTLKIYRDGNADERTSLNGVTQTEDFDAATGVHSVAIDLSDNTDDGFYEAGHQYSVVMTGMVIDTKTVNACIAMFSIERHAATRLSVDAAGNAKAQLANGVTHGGNAAVLQFLQLFGSNNEAPPVSLTTTMANNPAVFVSSSGENSQGIDITANGTGGKAVRLNGVSAEIALASIATLLAKLTGITLLAKWLRGLFRKDAMDATAKSEINDGGGGFDETTDSLQAVRDTAPLGTAMRGTDGAYTGTPPTAAAIGTDAAGKILATPANKLATDATGKVTYANDAPPTADAIGTDAASKVLATPANKLATDAEGKVTADVEIELTPEQVAAVALAISAAFELDPQQVRDALKLAPTAGDPAAGSIDKHLDDVLAKTSLITERAVEVVSPVAEDGTITITRGDDYAAADGTGLSVSIAEYAGPAVAGHTSALFSVGPETDGRPADLSVEATAEMDGTTLVLSADLTSAQTAALELKKYLYDFQIVLASGAIHTPARGTFAVMADVSPE